MLEVFLSFIYMCSKHRQCLATFFESTEACYCGVAMEAHKPVTFGDFYNSKEKDGRKGKNLYWSSGSEVSLSGLACFYRDYVSTHTLR